MDVDEARRHQQTGAVDPLGAGEVGGRARAHAREQGPVEYHVARGVLGVRGVDRGDMASVDDDHRSSLAVPCCAVVTAGMLAIMTTVADVVGEVLARLGVGHAFGVVGSGNFHVTNALRRGGVPFVAARHETGAAMMADAFARTSGAVTVLSLHQGCGLTNALTGIAEAAKSRTPLLVLAADTAGAAVRSNFRIDQDAAVRAVGAVPERVHTAASAVDDVVRAYGTCVRQRRTVVLNLPLDVQAAAGTLPDPCPPLRRGARRGRIRPRWRRSPRCSTAPSGRCSSRAAARGTPGPQLAALAERCGALLATSAVGERACSRATRGRWGSPGGSPRRSPPS